MARNQETVSRLTNLIKAAQIQRPMRQRRQLEGDKLDLDASVTAMVDLRSGRTPDPRVHERRGRTEPRPGSARAAGSIAIDQRLRPERRHQRAEPRARGDRAGLDAMEKIGDSFAIHGFDSNGRHEIEYYRLQRFRRAVCGTGARALGGHDRAAVHAHGHCFAPRRISSALSPRHTQADPAGHRRRAA
jgi:hypothetical protein